MGIMSAYLENINISRGHALASTALILSVLAILFAVSMRATPCVSAASGSCSVGETETFAGTLGLGKDADIEYEGATENDFETTLAVTDPTADRTITFPDASGTVALTGGGTLTVAEGGTGQTTLAANGVLVGNTTSGINVTAAGNAGEVLTSNGAGSDPTFQAAAASAYADMWRVDQHMYGNMSPITVGWEQADDPWYTALGSPMTESSGVFTFPATGVWKIDFTTSGFTWGTIDNSWQGYIQVTQNNGGSWDDAAYCDMGETYQASGGVDSCSTSIIFNVTDVSDDKVRFTLWDLHSNTINQGNTDAQRTGVVFVWLGNP